MSVVFTVAGFTAAENTTSMLPFKGTPIAPEAGVIAVTVSGAGGADGVLGLEGGVEGPLGVFLVTTWAPPQPAMRRGRTAEKQAVHLAANTLRSMCHHRNDSLASMLPMRGRVCRFGAR